MQYDKYPYDDEVMKYDYVNHRYVPQSKAYWNNLGENLVRIGNLQFNTKILGAIS